MYYRIKEARKAANLTQRELAQKMGVKVSTLSGYEIGAHDPGSNKLTKIAQICNTTVDWLLGIDDSDIPPKPYNERPNNGFDLLRRGLSPSPATSAILNEIRDGLPAYGGGDPDRDALLQAYDGLNERGRADLLKYARYLSADPDMTQDGESNTTTA